MPNDDDIAQRFDTAWRRGIAEGDQTSADLFPAVLAVAARDALGADGAGLSIFSEQHRVPIGASDATATSAERLQFTLGEGPCLQALAHQRVVRVDEDQISGDWPTYYAELATRTPYRSIVAVPIAITDNLSGALDLYFTSPTMAPYVTVTHATLVSAEVSTLLIGASIVSAHRARWTGLDGPAWMYGPQAQERLQVWVAAGVLMWHHNLPAPDALTLLRAHAYSHNQTVEQTSQAILEATLDPSDFRPLPPDNTAA